MFDINLVKPIHEKALDFNAFLEAAAKENHDAPWRERYSQLALNDQQLQQAKNFKRDMHILCVTGPWCGDCALQGAAMAHIAEAAHPHIDLRFANRNDVPELQVKVPINAGFRVPITFFMAEDFQPVSVFGDRTLSRYRAMARKALPEEAQYLPPPPEDPLQEVMREVFEKIEHVQLLLRLSGRLRKLHGD